MLHTRIKNMIEKHIPCCLLHAHSAYSTYDGMGLPSDRAKRVKKIGQTACSLTDHGTLSGLIDHYTACLKEEIKPILGLEAYHAVKFEASKAMKRHHLSLIAQNLEGYYNLCQMSSESNINNFYQKPIVDFELLRKYSSGIICLSGCVLGLLPHTIINETYDAAKRHTEKFLEIFDDRFYFEVQPQEFEAQRKANEGILQLAQEYHRPVVMTSDSHFIAPSDLESYILLRNMNYHEKKTNEVIATDDVFKIQAEKDKERKEWEEEIRQQYGRLYMPSGYELAYRWKAFMGTDGEAYVIESQNIADRCDVTLDFPELVPKVIEIDQKSQQQISSTSILIRKTKEGLLKMGKWYELNPDKSIKIDNKKPIVNKVYYDRVKAELRVIIDKKYEDYFLLVADMIEEARRRDIAVGPGRGSGGGSLVARAIGITEFDPVEMGCIMERFLQPHRMNLPDFDVDFDPYRRDELFDYMMRKYAGKAAPICNINRLTMSSLINDLAHALNINDTDKATMKHVCTSLGIGGKDKTVIPVYEELIKQKELLDIEKRHPKLVLHFCKLYGSMRGYSQHASGLAISSEEISKYVPLFVRGSADKRRTYTAYEMKALNALHIVKIDILGIDAVTAVQRMCKLTHTHHLDIPFDDQETFESYCNLNVAGIFQFESPGAQNIVKEVQPENIQEIAVCTGLNRPGSIELMGLKNFVNGKKGQQDTSKLAQFCQDTYGALIYQEQIMTACRELGNMSWASAAGVMKSLHGMNKKDSPLAQEFITGAATNGIEEQEAWNLYQKLTAYTFNKSHAIAYAILSYWMMYMKTHHPFEFFLSILQLEGSIDKRKEYIADAVRNRVVVLLPHVNGKRNFHFVTIQGDRFIREGLISIDGVGPAAANAIEKEHLANGDFTSEDDLLARVNGFHEVTRGRGKEKKTIKELNRSPIKSDTLTALRTNGALDFDQKIYLDRCKRFLGNLQIQKNRKMYKNGKG